MVSLTSYIQNSALVTIKLNSTENGFICFALYLVHAIFGGCGFCDFVIRKMEILTYNFSLTAHAQSSRLH